MNQQEDRNRVSDMPCMNKRCNALRPLARQFLRHQQVLQSAASEPVFSKACLMRPAPSRFSRANCIQAELYRETV